VRGDAYYQLLDEFLTAVRRRYGNTTLIHFNDMAYDNAAKLLNMYRTDFPCFSDELQVRLLNVGALCLSCSYLIEHILPLPLACADLLGKKLLILYNLQLQLCKPHGLISHALQVRLNLIGKPHAIDGSAAGCVVLGSATQTACNGVAACVGCDMNYNMHWWVHDILIWDAFQLS
jgi:hypothetical protein